MISTKEEKSGIKTHTFYEVSSEERTEKELIEYKRLIGMSLTEGYEYLIDSLKIKIKI